MVELEDIRQGERTPDDRQFGVSSVDASDTEDRSCFLDSFAAEIRRQARSGVAALCLDSLLTAAPWGRRQTERRFRDRFLTSPARYFRDCQWEAAEKMLLGGKDVLTVSLEAGFASPGRLHDAVLQRRGMTPGEVRRKGGGVVIRYGFFETQIGIVLIAATARGLCSLRLCQFTGSQEQLDEVIADFPNAEMIEAPHEVQRYANQLVAYLDQREATFLPRLDILRGTTFQREVWAELQRLPPGETISYAELARRVGRPSAVRAVAGACAANHLAIAIPCHRALRSNGSLAGFRWGQIWKRRLLDLEAEFTKA